MTDQEALDLVTAVLTGTTDPRTVTNVRPALQRLAAVVAGAGRVRELCGLEQWRMEDLGVWIPAVRILAALDRKDPS